MLVKLYNSILIVILFTVNLQLQGQCISGNCDNGIGERVFADSSRFVGKFENGAIKSGTFFYKSGAIFQGDFSNKLRTGFGTYTYVNKDVFKGIFDKNEKLYGTYTFSNGNVYTGNFENDKFNGYGILKYSDNSVWEGYWEDGKKCWGVNQSLNVDSVGDGLAPQSKSVSKAVSPRIFAVIVGIADYEGTLSDLNYSDQDARIFYQHLNSALKNETKNGKTILLLNKQATRQNIMNALNHVFSMSTKDDFIIFYFSGHGSPGYFCPTDYLSNKISHEAIKDYFKKAKAKYRLCVADACFSGSIGSSSDINSSSNASTLKDSRVAVIMSSKKSQTSIESGYLKQGLFSYHFINGLRGKADLNNDSYITMGELFIYTKRNVSKESLGTQVPTVYGKNLNLIPLAKVKR